MFETIKKWLGFPSIRDGDAGSLFSQGFPIPELRKSYTSADLSLRIEDQGWVRLGAQLVGDTDAATRTRLVQLARIDYHRDPLAKHVG